MRPPKKTHSQCFLQVQFSQAQKIKKINSQMSFFSFLVSVPHAHTHVIMNAYKSSFLFSKTVKKRKSTAPKNYKLFHFAPPKFFGFGPMEHDGYDLSLKKLRVSRESKTVYNVINLTLVRL